LRFPRLSRPGLSFIGFVATREPPIVSSSTTVIRGRVLVLTDRNEPIAHRVRDFVLLRRDVFRGLGVGSVNMIDELGRSAGDHRDDGITIGACVLA